MVELGFETGRARAWSMEKQEAVCGGKMRISRSLFGVRTRGRTGGKGTEKGFNSEQGQHNIKKERAMSVSPWTATGV